MTARAPSVCRARFTSLVGAALVLTLACGGPRPSAQPLGWGPLTPEMKAAAARADAARAAHARARATAAPAHRATPPGEETTVVVTEAPPSGITSAPGGTGGSTSPAAPATGTAAPVALKAADFVGDYVGDDVSTYRLEGIPERVEKDPGAKITVKSPGEPTIDLVLVDSSNGKEICTLRAALAGSEAKIAAGQKCFEQDGAESGAAASATVTSGTAKLEKARLVVDVSLDFEMRAGDRELTGTLEYHFDGAKK